MTDKPKPSFTALEVIWLIQHAGMGKDLRVVSEVVFSEKYRYTPYERNQIAANLEAESHRFNMTQELKPIILNL